MSDETDTTSKNVAKPLLKGSHHIIYRIVITNAAYTNRVITDNAAYTSRVSTDINAASGTGNAPIFGATEIYDEDDTQVWEFDSLRSTIKNRKTGLFAYPENMKKGARILESKQDYAWDVEREDGQLISIGSANDKLYWALTEGDNWTIITLQTGALDDMSWKWVFNRV